VWQNEVFGPVLAVRSFTTEAEAVAEANSTRFGLAATVMSKDGAKARRVANQIRAGAVYASSTGRGILFEFPNVQRGGFGCSGVGRELGLHGLYGVLVSWYQPTSPNNQRSGVVLVESLGCMAFTLLRLFLQLTVLEDAYWGSHSVLALIPSIRTIE
jgi:delta 1-pyrroline-5-carboxylate dehydrogenase